MRRTALTLVEVLVAVGIIVLLTAILLPAVQQVREVARRARCASHLHQMGVAIHAYHADHGIFPPGSSKGFSLHVFILPYVERAALFNAVNFSDAWPYSQHAWNVPDSGSTVRGTKLELYLCPSDPAGARMYGDAFGTNYAGNSGTGTWPRGKKLRGRNGLFSVLDPGNWIDFGPVRAADVTDGLGNTAAVSEMLIADDTQHPLRVVWNVKPARLSFGEFVRACERHPHTGFGIPRAGVPWTHGDVAVTMYNHVLQPNHNSCYNGGTVQVGVYSASSVHSAGVNVLFADGSVKFVSSDVDLTAWNAIGSRNGGERLPARF